MPFSLPRFYPILDADRLAQLGLDALTAASEMLEGGARILQFRHKQHYSRSVIETMQSLAHLCQQARVPFVVNDRADLAALFGAVLHLGQDDLPPAAARRVAGPDTIIGFSTHNELQLREALKQPVNYLALGPIFGTSSKQNPDPVVGLAELRRLRPLSQLPLAAIGGITRENAGYALAAGADSVAVIGDVLPPDRRIRQRVEDWIQATRQPDAIIGSG